MLIRLSELPTNKLQLIPLSIRLNSEDEIEFNDLPLSIQYKLKDIIEEISSDVYVATDAYDMVPRLSIYNDLETFQTNKETIIDYLKTYFQVDRGTYPNNPMFGHDLKKHVQTRNTSLRQTLISNELNNIVRVIIDSFNTHIQILKAEMVPFSTGGGIEYILKVTVKVEEEIVTYEVSK